MEYVVRAPYDTLHSTPLPGGAESSQTVYNGRII
jgi:hypothetical protein